MRKLGLKKMKKLSKVIYKVKSRAKICTQTS